jgi:phosphoribosylamine---glycine ligase
MNKYGIPTAKSQSFSDAAKARAYVKAQGAPIVVKADGLALGKGVFVCMSVREALYAVDSIMVHSAFGEAGRSIIVEEYMEGPEVSLLCFTDGKTVALMPPAQDHKRAYDGDLGPNTGGMGAFAPTPKLSAEQMAWAKENVLLPAVRGLAAEGCPFKGVLYAGLMLTKGGIKVLEFNARFGDPETQVILPLLETDLMDVIEAVREERLAGLDVRWSGGAAAVVVMASGGYPVDYKKGYPIEGLDEAEALAGVTVFHSGTKRAESRSLVTSGGRVLGVTAVASTLRDAIARAYEGVPAIRFEGCQYRSDIGKK